VDEAVALGLASRTLRVQVHLLDLAKRREERVQLLGGDRKVQPTHVQLHACIGRRAAEAASAHLGRAGAWGGWVFG
jgi:hypothetical protein